MDESAIAIIGMAGRFPDADNTAELWQNLRAGREAVRALADGELIAAGVEPARLADPDLVKAIAMPRGIELFDASFFGYGHREAEVMDPQQRLLLECAHEALEDAGHGGDAHGGPIGLFAGASTSTYLLYQILANPAALATLDPLEIELGNSGDYVTTRVSHKLDLTGPSLHLQTACSTSLVAVHLACQSLLAEECDLALAGGVSINMAQLRGYRYQQGGIASSDGHCRAFDARGEGAIGASGLGLVVLKRLGEAVADGDTIRAVIRGTAINNDGVHKVGFTAPSVTGQAKVITEALAVAGVSAAEISYVEAHGTGTALGDRIEIEALRRAFDLDGARRRCALGSIKTNLGHLATAAGIAGLIKTVLALEHRTLVPSLHFERPHPAIGLADSPFYVNVELAPWPAGPLPRRAGVSSFGMGGTNAHVVVEEAPPPPPAQVSARPSSLLLLSARSQAALDAATRNLASHLRSHPEIELADAAHTLWRGRRTFEHRRALVCRDRAEAIGLLADPNRAEVMTAVVERADPGVAFLFPGLGDQHLQMAAGLYAAEPVFGEALDRSCGLLAAQLGVDLREVIYPAAAGPDRAAVPGQPGPDLRRLLGRGEPPPAAGEASRRLDRTLYAQPAVFVVEHALACLWMDWGVAPRALLGYSLGEITAACIAGVLGLEDALWLVAERARLVDELPPSAMLAVPLAEGAARELLAPWAGALWLAAVNAPEMSVAAGTESAAAELEEELARRGVASRRVRTAHAFHTPLMAAAAERLAERLRRLRLAAPRVPLLSNLTGTWITGREATDPAYWTRHLCRPVRFAAGVGELVAAGHTLLEVGPGTTLGTFARQCQAETVVIHSLGERGGRGDHAVLLEAVGRLWLAGTEVDAAAFFRGERRRRVPLPTYPFERRRYWIDAAAAAPHGLAAAPAGTAAAAAAAAGTAPAGLSAHPRPRLRNAYVAPRNEVERRVAGLWQEQLGVGAVGVHDDFFELGGHSFLATRLVSELRRSFDCELDLPALFATPTVAGFAAVITVARPELAAAAAPMPAAAPAPMPGAAAAGGGTVEAPLSFAQERLWFLDRLQPGSPAYNLPGGERLEGDLDPRALAAALSALAGRHESLRTTFHEGPEGPVQRVAPLDAAMARLPIVDLVRLVPAVRERETARLARQLARVPFDLARGPLWRAALLRAGARDHLLLLNLHHMVSDGWSFNVLRRELVEAHTAAVGGRAEPPPAPAVSYTGFAREQRRELAGDGLAAERAWWRERLAGAPEWLELPADRPRATRGAPRGGELAFLAGPGAWEALSGTARGHGATPFMALAAGFTALLARLSGQLDVSIGTPSSGRNRGELEGVIGLFANTLVLRLDLAGAPGFAELLRRTREVVFGALAHQRLPFEKLVADLAPQRSLVHAPLFQVLLALQPAAPRLTLSGLRATRVPLTSGAPKFDLSLTLEEHDGALAGIWEYDRELFDGATIVRLDAQLARVLAAWAAAPEVPFAALPLLAPAERQQLVREWNDAPPMTSGAAGAALVPALFAAAARAHPEAVALVCESAALSYGELAARAGRLAAHLRRQGVGPEAVVAVALDRSPELVIALLAVHLAGGAYLPLDPEHPAERLSFMLADSGATVLLTAGPLAARLAGDGQRLPPALRVLLAGEARAAGAAAAADVPAPPAAAAPRPDDLAYVIYTSGSTGRPKGVAVPHGALANLLASMTREPGLEAGGTLLALTTVSFDIAALEIFLPLLAGGRLALVPRATAADGDRLRRELERVRPAVVQATPAGWRLLLDAGWQGDSALRALCGGEALPAELAERLRVRTAGLWNVYGPTEATIWASAWRVTGPSGAATVPIGRPVAGTSLMVLDRGGGPSPIGVVGELHIGGVQVARGYLGRPDLTAERFVPDPFGGPGARLYRTGDLARRLPGGEAEYLGRVDQQVKVRGHRIEPAEVEAALAAHPGVRQAAVLAAAEPSGEKRLVAWLVAAEAGAPLAAAELRGWLRARLPEHMVPGACFWLPALPLTPSGKVDRKALSGMAPALEQAPDRAAGARAPRTPLEELVAGLFAELLAAPAVGADSDFFDLGGHSLLATQLASRLRVALGIELPLRTLFQSPTVAGLAQALALGQRGGRALPPLVRRRGTADPPLSFAQARLWFLHRLEPESAAYNLPLALRLDGRLEVPALRHALDEVVRRHEALRTRFVELPGGPVQRVDPAAPRVLPEIDLRGLPAAAGEAELRRLAREEAARPFDLARGPLLRATLVRGAAASWTALFTLHHIVADGWSEAILVREVSALYAAALSGRPAALPELHIQLADFAVWQRGWLVGEALAAEVDHWRRRLDGIPAVLDLPLDRPRPPVQGAGGEMLEFTLPPGLAADLAALARRSAASLFMTLLAGFQCLLARLTGQQDIVVGAPIANRNHLQIERLIGFFVNTLPLRGGLAGDPPFAAVLRGARAAALAAFAHQDVPFERLVEELAPERSLAHTPLFQVVMTLQNAPSEALDLPGLTAHRVAAGPPAVGYDWMLDFRESDGAIGGSLQYRTELFDRATVLRVVDHCRSLLAAAAADPGCRLSELALLGEAERHQLTWEWQGPDAEAPAAAPADAGELLGWLFAAQARRTPDAVAVTAGTEQLSYAALEGRSNRVARHLRALGVGPEVRVGLLLSRSPAMVAGLLGVLKAGGAYVPLDPAYPEERLAFMAADSGAAVVLTEGDRAGRVAARLSASAVRWLRLDADWPRIAQRPASAVSPVGSPDNAAYAIYTSGSTGRPKGVVVTHRSVAVYARVYRARLGLDARERVLQFASLSFDVAVEEILPTLLMGARLVLAAADELATLHGLAAVIAREAVTTVELPTALWHEWVFALERAGDRPPRCLRWVLTGTEAVLPERVAAWRRMGSPLVHVYGLTEATVNSTFSVIAPVGREEAAAGAPDAAGPVPIGRPLAGTRIAVLDGALHEVPIGVTGEVCIGGTAVARGYLGRPGETASRFVPDPRGAAGERLYRTGDLGRYLADGDLVFLGRRDRQVKVRGFRVELGEVETVLRSLPGVRDAVVVARGYASGEQRLIGYVVGETGQPLAPPAIAELKRQLAARLPSHMVPSYLVALPALPLTANGKLDRAALPTPAPETAEAAVEAAGAAAAWTPVEGVLAAIWTSLLGVERVGREDDFFALGGHSLLATQLVSRARAALGVELPLRQVFEQPTLGAVAAAAEELLRAGAVAAAPPLVRQAGGGEAPLSFAQQRLWFIDQLQPGTALYNVPAAVRAEGALSLPVLARVLGEVVRRHEALRTVFVAEEGRARQVVLPPGRFQVPLVDLAALPRGVREDVAERALLGLARRPFDLARGPLFHAAAWRVDAAEHLVLLAMHHIVSDLWSLAVLVREVGALYPAYASGAPSPLPELAVQYSDFAAWQRGWLRGEALTAELGHWRRQLAGAPAALELPLDRPRAAVRGYRGATVDLAVPAPLVADLLALARRQGATLFMILLAAYQTLLARVSGQREASVGTPIAGRNRVETEGLIGFFVNTLVLRADVAGAASFAALLAQVRSEAVLAYTHQDLPFERLVEELAPERDLSQTPLFQAMFALQNVPIGELSLPGLRFVPGTIPETVAKFDLDLMLGESSAGMLGTLGYAAELFERATAHRLAGQLLRLLGGIVRSPELPPGELPLLDPAERHQLLHEWSVIHAERPDPSVPDGEAHLAALFAAQAARRPDAVAVSFGDAGLSYAGLERASALLARRLRGLGVGPDVRVGLFVERSLEMVVGMLGVARAGGAYVPLDPHYPAARLQVMLEDTRPPVVVGEERWLGRLPAGVAAERVPIEPAPAAAQVAGPPLPGPAELDPDHLVYVMHTSGSTGRPKGVAVTHRGVVRLVRDGGLAVHGPGEVFLHPSPASFDGATLEIWAPLASGGRLHLMPPGPPAPHEIADQVERGGVTLMNMTTGLFQEMTAAELVRLRSVRRLLAGGDVMQPAAARRALAALPGLWLGNAYGPTENTTLTTCHWMNDPAQVGQPVSLGPPIGGTGVYVVDPWGGAAPVGVAGELLTGGAGLARGYLDRPDLTAERWVPDTWSGGWGRRLYRIGDRVRWRPDGRLEFLGRQDHQVKVRGHRIELGEVEVALAADPRVRDAVAAVHQDERDKRLVAYVVPAPGCTLTLAGVREHLGRRLPEPMVPTALVLLDALPLTAHGKVDRRALPPPGRAVGGAGADRVAPRTPFEEILAGIWEEVLGTAAVSVHDNFFAIGGHSLLATRVVSRLRTALQLEVALADLFASPTLAALAERVQALANAKAGTALPPIGPRPRAPQGEEELLPLSFAQERLWVIDRLQPGSTAYHVQLAVRLRGALDAAALHRALALLVERQETLRTRFVLRHGAPRQLVSPFAPPALPRVELAGLAPGRQEEALRRLVEADSLHPFDLGQGPLFRATLVGLGAADHALLANLHHIVADGWSLEILLRELAALYTAVRDGRDVRAALPALALQYADYAVWQRGGWLAGERLERELAYWRQALAGVPVLELPADRPRHWSRRGWAGTRPIALSAGLTAEVARLARARGVTLFMALLAGFELVLQRHTGLEDLAVGSAIANRTRREIEDLVGFFVNSLVLRTVIPPHATGHEALRRVCATALGAYAHQDVPFEKLAEELQPGRGAHLTPFFQVVFALQNAPMAGLRLPGLTLSQLPNPVHLAKFELSVALMDTPGGGLDGVVEYARELFDGATIERLARQFAHLLGALAAAPERPVAELPLLGAAERHQLAAEWNDTRRALPAAGVHQLFAGQAALRPDAVALVSAAGAALTYGELDRRAERLARRLRRAAATAAGLAALPVPPRLASDTPVGVLLGRSPELVTALLATLKAGGAYLPLDPAYPDGRLALMLRDTGARLAVTTASLAARLGALQGTRIVAIDVPEVPGAADAPAAGSAGGAAAEQEPADEGGDRLAYVMYTSGSTGRPKGVAVSHRGVVRLVRETAYVRFGPDEALLQLAPASFDASTYEIWGTLLHGGRLVLAPEGSLALPELVDIAERHQLTSLWMTTALFHLLVDHQLPRLGALPALRQLMTGGELMSPQHVRQALAGLPATRLTIFYGPTENTTFTSYCPLVDGEGFGATVPLGRPIANSRVVVVDREGRLAPVGAAGELCTGGDGLARGYLGRPELTAERFIPDAFGPEPGGRLYRTGDLARVLPDGRLDFLGRIDDQVKLRGYRIEPGEIEARLLEHPGVREAVVLLCEQPPGNRFLAAYVVGDRAAAAPAELRAHLRDRLPEHMVPAAFVTLDALPLNPHGKVDRRRLPLPEAKGIPAAGVQAAGVPGLEGVSGPPALDAAGAADAAGEAGADLAAAAGPAPDLLPALLPVPELLAGLWRELLRVERVELGDSFFDLGGYSLVATGLQLRVREIFGVEISLYRLFDEPTLAGMVAEVEEGLQQARGPEPPPLLPRPAADRDAPLPLSFAQQRLWIISQLEPGSTAYHVPFALRLTGELDIAALRHGLGEILRRHEALRTRFAGRGGVAVQTVVPFAPPALPRIDLTGLVRRAGTPGGGGRERQERELRRLIAAESRRPFDLARGPLFRATLAALGEGDHALLATMHHIVSDGWSVGVMLHELAALYGAHRAGRRAALPALPVQYADYAVWQRQWLAGETLEREVAWWRQALDGVGVLDLPTDRPRHWTRQGEAGAVQVVVPAALAAELAELACRQGVTLFMVLLAAFDMLLARYTGQEDFAVGSPIANRTRREIEGLVGFFVNTLVLRAAVAPAATVRDVLHGVRATALGAYTHQDVPFEKLVEELQPVRGPHRSPLFQVFFVLQNAPLPARRLPGLMLSPLPVPILGAKFELSLALVPAEDGSLVGDLDYGRELFDAATIGRLIGHYVSLLRAMTARPAAAAAAPIPRQPAVAGRDPLDQEVGALPLLSAAERHQLQTEWNDTVRAQPSPAAVHRLFAEQAAARPDAVALVSAAGARISYGELDRRSGRLARRLLARGLAPDTPVGVLLPRSPEMVLSFLAILGAGGAYVPLEPTHPEERLELMLADTGAPLVVTAAPFRGRLAGREAAIVQIDEDGPGFAAGAGAAGAGAADGPGDACLPEVTGAHLANVIFTSGSTGRPKGVGVTHAGIVRVLREGGFVALGPDEVVLHTCAVSFDVATFEIWGALLSGATLSVLPSGAPALDELGAIIARDGVTTLWLSAGLFTLMVNHRLGDLRPVRQLLAGGDVVPLPQAWRVLDELPHCRLIDGYGPTESTIFTLCHQVRDGLAGRASVPVGRPIGNTRVAILDGALAPQPAGVAGELHVGGLGLARGYFGRPDLTAERFVPDPFSGLPGERLYRTGDRCRWLPDGTVEFLGRTDHQVKVRGFRIELGEIETVLARHPAVAECVAMAREDRPGDRRLVAYVVPAGHGAPAPGELAAFLGRTLPGHMIPAVFVSLPRMPLSPSGKPDRAALPPPPDVTAGREGSYVPPRTRLEERIAAVWREALGVERVGAHDNFFSLGGHSLLLLAAVARLREELGRPLQPIEMFEHPTVAALALHLAPAGEGSGVGAEERGRHRGAARRQSLGRRARGPVTAVPEPEEEPEASPATPGEGRRPAPAGAAVIAKPGGPRGDAGR